jgi:hypothetical protein
MAVAFEIADDARAEKVMKHIGSLPCVRPGGYGTMLTGVYMGEWAPIIVLSVDPNSHTVSAITDLEKF